MHVNLQTSMRNCKARFNLSIKQYSRAMSITLLLNHQIELSTTYLVFGGVCGQVVRIYCSLADC